MSMLLIFVPPLLLDGQGEAISQDGVGNWRGDLISVFTGVSMASLLTTARYVAIHRPGLSRELAMALGPLGAGVVTESARAHQSLFGEEGERFYNFSCTSLYVRYYL